MSAAYLFSGDRLDLSSIEILTPIPAPGKNICVGLNCADYLVFCPLSL